MNDRKKVATTWRNIHLFKCKCGSLDHEVTFTYWEDIWKYAEPPELFMNWLITSTPLFRRIKNAIMYVFRKEPIYVQEVLMDLDDVKELQKGLDRFLKISIKNYIKYNREHKKGGLKKNQKV